MISSLAALLESRVFTRLGDGQLALSDALVNAPCPPGLSPDLCETYGSELARRASTLVESARVTLERARQEAITGDSGVDRLRRPDRKRLKGARVKLSVLQTKTAVRAPIALAKSPTTGPRIELLCGSPGSPLSDFPAAPVYSGRPVGPTPDIDFVLVDKTAWLSSKADGTGQRFREAHAPDVNGEAIVWTARLLEVRGDRVLLEFGPGQWDYHCSFDTPWSDAWRVRVWADRAALHPVVTRPVEESFPDETSIAIGVGAPIVDGGVLVGRLRVPVTDLADHVGDRYRESDAFEGGEGRHVAVPVETALSVGGETLSRPFADDALFAVPSGDGLLTFDSKCGQVVVAGRLPQHSDSGGLMGGLVGGMVGGSGPLFKLAAGTPLWFPDGARGQGGPRSFRETVRLSSVFAWYALREPGRRLVANRASDRRGSAPGCVRARGERRGGAAAGPLSQGGAG